MTPDVAVLKVGGNEVDDSAWLARLAGSVAARGGPAVLVHGGGKEVSALQRALGTEPEWRDGLRVTGPEAMRAVSMVLSGVVNKRIVAALLTAGADAVGVSGEDGALLRARVSRGGALGRTGEVEAVRVGLLRGWLEQGLLPVVSPVSRGPDGGPLNVNADDVAAEVAAALGAGALLFVSNVAGVLAGGVVVPEIGADEVEALVADGTASGGMAPKLRAAARAAERVGTVRIGGPEMLWDDAAGTRVLARAAVAG
ncbi:MAG TPA: acetylglutamate kinase [Longimicrobiaceae bacterium]|nr:acetylglutamate kinase [Longimicrobiaceae bacterium]